MSFSKLKKMHIAIIGSVLIVGAIVAIYFLMVKPQNEAFEAAKARYDTASVLGNQLSENKAKADLNTAIMDKARVQQNLDTQMDKRMPKLNFSRRETAMIALWHEQIENLGPTLEAFARDKDNKNVHVGSPSFKLPAPPVSPNDAVFAQDMLSFDVGSLMVEGDFKSLMNNVRRWNNCNRLVMLGPPQIIGISPQLVMAYPLRCYVYPLATAGSNSLVQIAGSATTTPGH